MQVFTIEIVFVKKHASCYQSPSVTKTFSPVFVDMKYEPDCLVIHLSFTYSWAPWASYSTLFHVLIKKES